MSMEVNIPFYRGTSLEIIPLSLLLGGGIMIVQETNTKIIIVNSEDLSNLLYRFIKTSGPWHYGFVWVDSTAGLWQDKIEARRGQEHYRVWERWLNCQPTHQHHVNGYYFCFKEIYKYKLFWIVRRSSPVPQSKKRGRGAFTRPSMTRHLFPCRECANRESIA